QHQQDYRNDPDKHVGYDQPVAQPPQKLLAQITKSNNREKENRQPAQETDPPPNARRNFGAKSARQRLGEKEKNVERENVHSGASHAALRPQALITKLALEFERYESHPPPIIGGRPRVQISG